MPAKIFSAASVFIILSVEKILQHLITALLFVVEVKSLGKPDIGENIQINDATMAWFNLAFALLFGLGLFLFFKGNAYGYRLICWLAFADIVLEFIFHGIGFITISVIVSGILVLLGVFRKKLGIAVKNSSPPVKK